MRVLLAGLLMFGLCRSSLLWATPLPVQSYQTRSCFASTPTFQSWVDQLRPLHPWYSAEYWFLGWMLPQQAFEHSQQHLHCQQFSYDSDQQQVDAWALWPKQPGRYPVIIYNRGGSAAFGRLELLDVLRQLSPLADQGFLVLASQYRGSRPGESQDEFGGADLTDIHRLITLAQQHPQADPNQIFMYGVSRGGLMTLLAAKQLAPLKAIAVTAAPTDLPAELKRRPEFELIFRSRIPDYLQHREQALQQRSAWYWYQQLPANLPILFMQGELDDRVSPALSQRFVEQLTRLQRPVKYVELAGADHLLTRHKEQERQLVVDWFRQHSQTEATDKSPAARVD